MEATCAEITAGEMHDHWVLDGPTTRTVHGSREMEITAPDDAQTTLWNPAIYTGRLEVEFDCFVPEPHTKLLLLVHGLGSDGSPVTDWQRTAAYDEYNAGRMEVYTIAFNRGPHIAEKLGQQLANVRRIGGPLFAEYTADHFQTRGPEFWEQWDTDSLLGGAREPVSGLGRWLRYHVIVDPPRITLAVEGTAFAEFVDHRPEPLFRGSMAFRNMSKGKSFIIRNLVLREQELSRHTGGQP